MNKHQDIKYRGKTTKQIQPNQMHNETNALELTAPSEAIHGINEKRRHHRRGCLRIKCNRSTLWKICSTGFSVICLYGLYRFSGSSVRRIENPHDMITKQALQQSQNFTGTIVTAYFRIKAKHSTNDYNTWMPNMLSLQDPMALGHLERYLLTQG